MQGIYFSGALLKQVSHPAAVSANTAGKVFSMPTHELLEGRDPGAVVLLAQLEQDGRLIDSKEHYYVPAKDIKLEAPSIKVTEAAGSGGTRFTLETDKLAKQYGSLRRQKASSATITSICSRVIREQSNSNRASQEMWLSLLHLRAGSKFVP